MVRRSIFKIISSSALLEYGGLTPDSQICTHGGHHKLTLYNLKPSERLDTKCETFAQALGSSNNVAFAPGPTRSSRPTRLKAMANRFLHGKRIPIPWAVGVSRGAHPDLQPTRPRAAAGFEGATPSTLRRPSSPRPSASDGVMMAPYLVQRADKGGAAVFEATPAKLAEVLTPAIAAQLRGMLEETVTYGTGRKFFEKKGAARLPVRAGGKSGSLSGKDDGITRNYSWFVAFAPIDKPEIAVAALVVNGEEWTVKGAVPHTGVLDAYFDQGAAKDVDPADQDPLAAPWTHSWRPPLERSIGCH